MADKPGCKIFSFDDKCWKEVSQRPVVRNFQFPFYIPGGESAKQGLAPFGTNDRKSRLVTALVINNTL